MPENYEVSYTHPGGATATFVRQGGELDALAKGLDSEQFWVFKQVKALLARNEAGDLAEASRMMADIGFTQFVREITPAEPAPSVAAMRAEALSGTMAATGARAAVAAHGAEAHEAEAHHGPQPSLWPLLLAISVAFALVTLMFWQIPGEVIVTAIGLACVLICIIGWGTEAFHAEF
jgi:hypothetical protein